jgi:hypothetical protein
MADFINVGGQPHKEVIGKFIESIGVKLVDFGTNLITKSKPLLVTNPSAKLINPFTLLLTFTVNTVDKYQLVLQGDYKQRYKDSVDKVDNDPNMSFDEMFVTIASSKDLWFKKE